ncbi:putative lyase [Gordonia araii NBRC 100433]|uniref:Putative lyase n=1 Tax=Gordonia araii NBRC 100433 TaxID=1073574 RepID=G7H311_9ACTN|nr:aminotransferase class V-fold PLP-dependent enzyme [Gordonia araii]NNG97330.1 aspartate aminotransferase family protein [Gordonia araii NBRC 100433]GAB10236.1 putative lyase [Gordonia araii NBRC 100433]
MSPDQSPSSPLAGDADAILARLRELRSADAPTHGGRILSYVYDSGLAALDDLAAAAAREVQPVNGLDPTVFTSVATMERELIAFARNAFQGPGAVGSVTSGGTESCLLAVKAARDRVSRTGRGSVVLPTTAHVAFVKAAHVLDVDLVRVPVDPDSTSVDADAVAGALRDDTFLIVASAPNYPTGVADPIGDLGRLALDREIALHVDACLGGFALAWWPEDLAPWDFAVPGVSSISADLHKYGYSPKGASILLHADRDRHRAQYFATTDWPGYPVVNPTLLGSRSAAGLAAAWAIVQYLGDDGFRTLVAAIARATTALRGTVEGIDGLRVVGDPVGPVFAVAADDSSASPIDPHRWARAVGDAGFELQLQPSFTQADSTVLPATTHLTVTPVTETVVDELSAALIGAADRTRGQAPAEPPQALADLAAAVDSGDASIGDLLALPSSVTADVLVAAGIDPHDADGELDMAAIVAAVQALPRPITAKMLTEFLASYTNPE